MQSDHREIYKKTSERTGEDEQTYRDIGNAVFSLLNKTMRQPPSLIIKLKGIGAWHLRKRRMEIIVETFPPVEDTEGLADVTIKHHEDRKAMHGIFQDRLKDYEKYLELRNSIRAIRRTTQHLIEPYKDEE